MIIGIGCDLVAHERTKALKWDSDLNARSKILSKEELAFYHENKSITFIAGRFAAKEAIVKCLVGMQDGISLTEIQILKSVDGKPNIELFGGAKELADKLGINYWHLSITHCDAYSSAFAIAEYRSS